MSIFLHYQIRFSCAHARVLAFEYKSAFSVLHVHMLIFFQKLQNQNQNCYWWHVQMTIIHQDLWSGKLAPSPYKRNELSNRVFCTFSSRKERIWKWIPISNSLGEETALVNVSISKGGLKCQRVMPSDKPNWGDKVIRRYTGCTLQTFVKHYDSTISPLFFRDSYFSCSRMPVILPVS